MFGANQQMLIPSSTSAENVNSVCAILGSGKNMSRELGRRIFFITISLLFGLVIAEGIRNLFSPPLNGWISFFLTGTLAILATVLGLFL